MIIKVYSELCSLLFSAKLVSVCKNKCLKPFVESQRTLESLFN